MSSAQRGSAFVSRSSRDLDLIFALQFQHTVNRDNTLWTGGKPEKSKKQLSISTTVLVAHSNVQFLCRSLDVAAKAGVLNASQITSSPSGVGLTVYLHSRGSQP